MANLANFRRFIVDASKTLNETETELKRIQEKYESFFHEVVAVRESELGQLREHLIEAGDRLPDQLRSHLDRARAEAEKSFDESRAALEEKLQEVLKKAEETRQTSRKDELAIHSKNKELDEEEEALKARNEKLLAQIEDFNERIRSLGKGFGFFSNFFSMNSLQKERTRLLEEQRDVVARIEQVRQMWFFIDQEYGEREKGYQKTWIDLETEAATLRAKIDALDTTRESMIERSTLEAVLFALKPNLPQPSSGDPPCPRCGMPNPESYHFCHVCAKRLKEDQLDFRGSLIEIAEVNVHHERFTEGIQACQEIIGLVSGLRTGHGNFLNSVDSMIDSENRYPIAELKIHVPAASQEYRRNFDRLLELAKSKESIHPVDFANRVKAVIVECFTEDKIKAYFENMGDELSKQAGLQW